MNQCKLFTFYVVEVPCETLFFFFFLIKLVSFSLCHLVSLSGFQMDFMTCFSQCRFANPYLAFMMFVPSSLAGLLTPRIVWRCLPLSQDFSSLLKSSKEVLIFT